ncbi:MAG: chromosome partitioning protein ParB [Anaerolineae bacterium]|nr:chromosome partitioning protein ParB [Anaerolineae bacterium]MCA9889793.1 chromosome partitioning protein ParB [Anaerolineae bacterium]MCA9894607.1 hypothetical protein [Anaerolineae bacterium]
MPKYPEHGYEERRDGKISYWRASTLWRLSEQYPVEHVPLDSFDWTNRNFQCGALSDPPLWRDIGDHMRRILAADLQYPIIISPHGNIMDGMHRILKCYAFGLPTIQAVRLPQMPEPDIVTEIEEGTE